MKTIINVANLKCHGCANTITKGLQKLDKVEHVVVDVEKSSVEINYYGTPDLVTGFKTKLMQMGYPETGQNSMGLKARSYVSCAVGRITK